MIGTGHRTKIDDVRIAVIVSRMLHFGKDTDGESENVPLTAMFTSVLCDSMQSRSIP